MRILLRLTLPVLTLILLGAGCAPQAETPRATRATTEPTPATPAATLPPSSAPFDIREPSFPLPPSPLTPTTPTPCPLTETLVRRHCTVSGKLEQALGCNFNVKPATGLQTIGIPMITFSTQRWLNDFKTYWVNSARVAVYDWLPEEAGVGEQSFLSTLPGLGTQGTRETLEQRGYYLFVKKGNLAYQFVGQPKNPAGFCTIAQMKTLAQEVLRSN